MALTVRGALHRRHARLARASRAGSCIEAWREQRRRAAAALMVGPSPVTPFERQVIVDAGEHYETGTFTWLPAPRSRSTRSRVPKNERPPRRCRGARDAGIPGVPRLVAVSVLPARGRAAAGTRVSRRRHALQQSARARSRRLTDGGLRRSGGQDRELSHGARTQNSERLKPEPRAESPAARAQNPEPRTQNR